MVLGLYRFRSSRVCVPRCVCQQYAFAGPSMCLGLLRFPPDCGSGPAGLPALLGFRPVRPAPSAWHEMPGWAFPGLRRPARAALSTNSPCAGWYACAGTLRGGRAIRVGRDRGGRAPAPANRDAPMSTSTHALRAPKRRVAGVELRAGLTGRKGLAGWGPGIASRADGAGLTGRNRKGRVLNEELRVCARFAATGAHRPLVRSGALMPPGSFHGSRSFPFPVLAFLCSSCVCQQYAFAGLSPCLGVLRFPPDCGSGPVGLPALWASGL
jgi:hypothetical protein